MDAEKWCKEHKNKYFQTGDITEASKQVCYEILMEFAKDYHQSKVNNGVLADVNGTCCENPKHATEVNDMFESWTYCKNCDKDII